MVCLLIGCTREQLEDHEFKNTELGEEWNCFIFNNGKKEELTLNYEIAKTLTSDNRIVSRIMTPRLLLQLLGTECGRDILHPNLWVISLFSKYNSRFSGLDIVDFSKNPPETKQIHRTEESKWIITDVRFPNELETIKKRGGITIRVNRDVREFKEYFNGKEWVAKSIPTDIIHFSETALDNAEFDYTINNDSSIEDLIHTVSLILKREKII